MEDPHERMQWCFLSLKICSGFFPWCYSTCSMSISLPSCMLVHCNMYLMLRVKHVQRVLCIGGYVPTCVTDVIKHVTLYLRSFTTSSVRFKFMISCLLCTYCWAYRTVTDHPGVCAYH